MKDFEKTVKHFQSLQKRYTTQHNENMCDRVADALEALYEYEDRRSEIEQNPDTDLNTDNQKSPNFLFKETITVFLNNKELVLLDGCKEHYFYGKKPKTYIQRYTDFYDIFIPYQNIMKNYFRSKTSIFTKEKYIKVQFESDDWESLPKFSKIKKSDFKDVKIIHEFCTFDIDPPLTTLAEKLSFGEFQQYCLDNNIDFYLMSMID